MRQLYHSNYTGIPAYLMDFGFGGFLRYGRRVSCCEVEEELKMYEDRHLAEDFIFTGNYDTDEITRNVRFPCCEFLQCDDITWHDDWCK